MTNKQMVYRFTAMPYVIQRQIAHEMNIVLHGEKFDNAQLFHVTFLKRCSTEKMIDAVKRRLDPTYKPLPPTETQPCE